MRTNAESAPKIAEFLLQIKAIKLQPEEPFTWASGWKSPIYCDNRKTLSFPKIRTYIRQQFVETIEKEFGMPDAIAGVATGAIAHGVLVAEALGLPFVYVRPEAKKHGLNNQIEGEIEKGKSVVVIEDLVSTGGSSLKAVNTLREAGCEVKGMSAIFTYGFDVAKENFEKADCDLVTLCDYQHLIHYALEHNHISEADVESLSNWRVAPDSWEANVKS